MFDIEKQLRHWRQETEATLAFESDEIDELEDHLKLALETALQEGLSPQQAWKRAISRLGTSSSLALEFAKSKLMPALFHLLGSWWQPALLLVLFAGTFLSSMYVGKSWQGELFWALAWLSLLGTLLLLPAKSAKNALLLGVGNAFCLIPLLHIVFYNPWADSVVGTGWSRMAASFGWVPLSLGLIGLFLINAWWWKRSRDTRKKIPGMVAVASIIVLLLTLSPFCTELIGNLSMRELYHLPTPHEVNLKGEALTKFMNTKEFEPLMDSMIYILTWIPLVFITMVSIGILTLQWGFRVLKVTELSERQDFPAAHDLPWIMMLITSGVCWIYAHSVEPRISEQIRHAEKAGALGTDSHCGMEIVVLSSAYLFLICGYELTSRLQQSICIRLFYASTLVVAGIGVFIGVSILPAWLPGHTFSGQHDVSAQPEWLTWILGVILVLIVVRQTWLIRKKFRAGDYALSLWKFKGKDLVWFGLMLGLILGCAGMILMLGALNMAFISVVYIHALISWGNSITKPATNYFNPQDYGIHDHFYFWAICGLGYTSLCLALGLGAAMVLSALEFIRFNCFRFYKAWRANQAAPPTLALQD